MLLSLKNVSIAFGGPLLLDGADFQISENDKICLLGRNGAGKSTLMKILDGQIKPDSGEVIRTRGITTGYLSQDIPDLHGFVYQIIADAFGAIGQAIGAFYLEGLKAEPDHELLARLQMELDHYDGWSKIQQIDKIIARLELDSDKSYQNLSIGLKRRTILARELVKEPDVLLLDEPTNHLDVGSIMWLEDFFSKYNKSLIFVTHDRAFLQAVATSIYELDRGKLSGWICDYATFLERKEAELIVEEEHQRQFDKKLAIEEAWVRQGIKARRTRNEGRVRALKALRNERMERRDFLSKAGFALQSGTASGNKVIVADKISFAYPDKTILKHFSTLITRGDKVGILGQNGCGKSTLLKILLQQLTPTGGKVEHGTNLEIAYFDQTRLVLEEDKSILDNITDGSDTIFFNSQPRHIFSYLNDFLFPKDRLNTPVSALSGGEKNRLLLAKLFSKPANLLILDEPTNDLDQETLELLETLLVEFTGTAIIVSHDRAFINNVVTSSIIFESTGDVKEYVGGYENWQNTPVAVEKPIAKKAEVKEIRVKVKERKLSFKEKNELAELPAIIEAMEDAQLLILAEMSNPDFFKKPYAEIKKIQDRQHEIEKLLPQKYARWEELEALPQ